MFPVCIRVLLVVWRILDLQSDWRLLYSSDRDGCSLKTLYRRVAHCGPVILVVVDSHGHVFGAFASEEIRVCFNVVCVVVWSVWSCGMCVVFVWRRVFCVWFQLVCVASVG